MKKIKNYVSTYNSPIMKIPNSIPIEVGASDRDTFLYELRDDSGQNISAENPYYGELTGLYWIWKNSLDAPEQLVGFNHYNKYLKISKQNLKNYQVGMWFVGKKRPLPRHGDSNEWVALSEILKEYFPEYYVSLQKYFSVDGSSKGCFVANMFVTTKSELDEYSEFLFKVCTLLRQKLGDNNKDLFNKRYCAFMAERLLSIYLYTNNKKIIEVPIVFNKYYITYLSFIVKILKVNKNSKFYKIIRDKLLKNSFVSSYRKN